MTTTYLRHAARYIQQTVGDDIEAALLELGWVGPATGVPFGAEPFEFLQLRLDESEMKALTSNTIVVSWGDEPDWDPQELGGGMVSIGHVLFVDVLGESEAVALAAAVDVKDVLSGQAPGYSRYHDVRDYSQAAKPPVPGYKIEIEEVVRERPIADWRRNWQTVKGTATVYFPGPE